MAVKVDKKTRDEIIRVLENLKYFELADKLRPRKRGRKHGWKKYKVALVRKDSKDIKDVSDAKLLKEIEKVKGS